VLEAFEHTVVQQLATLYETINQHLIGEGILPRLRAYPQQFRQGGERPRDGQPAREREQPAEADATAAATPVDAIAVLETLRELLAQQRSVQSFIAQGDRPATMEELQLALGALQQHLTEVTQQATRELRDAQHLRKDLLLQLNAGKADDAQRTQLSAEQNDIVELVSLLFEQLGLQLQWGGSAHTLLHQLQLPLLRMAVTDRGFFDQHEHPARKLLSAVTEAANDWLDSAEGDPDHSLAAKLEQLVERTRHEPPSADLYTDLVGEIEHHLTQLNRKAQIAEKRQIEAMQGRERLEQARRRAARLMSERFERTPPRGLLRTLLERAWSDVLALTLLRNGEDSEVFATRLRITDQLLGSLPIDDREQLLREVETGLQQIGMHPDEAGQVAQRLLGRPDPAVAGENTPSTLSLAMKLKQHQRLGEHPAGEAPQPVPSAPAPHQLNSQEEIINERLRKMPFGSWFEFVDPTSGRVTLRKLAWYSPVSGNSLFVTRRGLRGEEIALERLAHDIAAGHVREAARTRDNLFDRAMHALTGSLRQTRPSPTRPEGDTP
jgi:hypothetical protein